MCLGLGPQLPSKPGFLVGVSNATSPSSLDLLGRVFEYGGVW